MSKIETMLNAIEEIKEKITDQQYKNLIEGLGCLKDEEKSFYKIRYYMPVIQSTCGEFDVKLDLAFRETIIDMELETPTLFDLGHLKMHSISHIDFQTPIDVRSICEACDETNCERLIVQNENVIIVSCEKINLI